MIRRRGLSVSTAPARLFVNRAFRSRISRRDSTAGFKNRLRCVGLGKDPPLRWAEPLGGTTHRKDTRFAVAGQESANECGLYRCRQATCVVVVLVGVFVGAWGCMATVRRRHSLACGPDFGPLVRTMIVAAQPEPRRAVRKGPKSGALAPRQKPPPPLLLRLLRASHPFLSAWKGLWNPVRGMGVL